MEDAVELTHQSLHIKMQAVSYEAWIQCTKVPYSW